MVLALRGRQQASRPAGQAADAGRGRATGSAYAAPLPSCSDADSQMDAHGRPACARTSPSPAMAALPGRECDRCGPADHGQDGRARRRRQRRRAAASAADFRARQAQLVDAERRAQRLRVVHAKRVCFALAEEQQQEGGSCADGSSSSNGSGGGSCAPHGPCASASGLDDEAADGAGSGGNGSDRTIGPARPARPSASRESAIDTLLRARTRRGRLGALQRLSQLLAGDPDGVGELLSATAGTGSAILASLRCADAELQRSALWCLANCAAGSAATLALSLAPQLIVMLDSGYYGVRDLAAWALGNLAGDSDECRRTLRSMGIVRPLIRLLDDAHCGVVRSAAFALSNLLATALPGGNLSEFLEAGIVAAIGRQLQRCADDAGGDAGASSDVARDAESELAWALSYLIAADHAESDAICHHLCNEYGTLGHLMRLFVRNAAVPDLASTSTGPVLRSLGHLVSSSAVGIAQEQAIAARSEFWPALCAHLTCWHEHVQLEALWLLGNLAAGSDGLAHAILSSSSSSSGGCVVALIAHLYGLPEMQSEAALALANLARHGPDCGAQLAVPQVAAAVVHAMRTTVSEDTLESCLCLLGALLHDRPSAAALGTRAHA